MRLALVSSLRSRLRLQDVDAVNTKLVEVLEAVTLRLESILGGSFTDPWEPTKETFYIDPRSTIARGPRFKLNLTHRFLYQDPEPTITYFTAFPADGDTGEAVSLGDVQVNYDLGVVQVFRTNTLRSGLSGGLPFVGGYLVVEYQHGLTATPDPEGFDGDYAEEAPEWLRELAVLAGVVEMQKASTQCEEAATAPSDPCLISREADLILRGRMKDSPLAYKPV